MKKTFLLLTIFLSVLNNAQDNFRLSEKNQKEIVKISPDVAKNIMIVEYMISTKENPNISIIEQSIANNNLSSKQAEKIKSIVCIPCYEKEWQNITEIKYTEKINKEKFNDSVKASKLAIATAEKNRLNDIEVAKKIEYNKYQDSIRNAPSDENPYDVLKRSLYAFSKNKSITVLRKMDYNFAGGNVQWFMQYDMRMGMSKEYKSTATQIIEKYLPKVSSKDESVKVIYNGSYHKDMIGYYPADEVFIIDNVIFTGSSNYIIDLFLNYWPGKITIGGYKNGVIATKQLLGDFISLIGEGGKYKITVTKGNMDVNYNTTFGINKKK